MFKSESDFRKHIATLLEKEGFTNIQKEFRVPEGYRVDFLAMKDGNRVGIEVKLNPRGIADDISKASVLNKLPEFDHIYVVAPKIHLHSELISCAKQARVGIAGITEASIEWLLKPQKLGPAVLQRGWSFAQQVIIPGSIFELVEEVRNIGEKVARRLEMFFRPSGPFVTPPGGRSRFKPANLHPGKSWTIHFKVKVKNKARKGSYPLFFGYVAEGIEKVIDKQDIEIGSSE
jgi:hypothetical protein